MISSFSANASGTQNSTRANNANTNAAMNDFGCSILRRISRSNGLVTCLYNPEIFCYVSVAVWLALEQVSRPKIHIRYLVSILYVFKALIHDTIPKLIEQLMIPHAGISMVQGQPGAAKTRPGHISGTHVLRHPVALRRNCPRRPRQD